MNPFWTWAGAILVWTATQLTPGGTVSGTIRAPGGAPATGVRVVAIEVPSAARAGTSVFARITQTDSNGRYQLEDVPLGRYYIAAGPVSSQTFHPGTVAQDKASVIAISRERSDVNGIDFTMTMPQGVSQPVNCCVFSVRMVAEDGTSVPAFPGVRVFNKGGNPGLGGTSGIVLNPGTTAELFVQGLPPGYFLKSQAYGGNTPAVGPFPIAATTIPTVLLTLGFEPVDTLKPVTVRGKVSNVAPELNFSRLNFTSTIPGGPSLVTAVLPDGSFEFQNIPVGAYFAGVLNAAGKELVSSAVTVIRDAGSDVVINFRNNPFPEYESAAPTGSPFEGGTLTEITGVVTQRYTRIGPEDSGYFRIAVKDAATGTVASWAVYAAREFHVPKITPGETLVVPGTKSTDGTNRLFVVPF